MPRVGRLGPVARTRLARSPGRSTFNLCGFQYIPIRGLEGSIGGSAISLLGHAEAVIDIFCLTVLISVDVLPCIAITGNGFLATPENPPLPLREGGAGGRTHRGRLFISVIWQTSFAVGRP